MKVQLKQYRFLWQAGIMGSSGDHCCTINDKSTILPTEKLIIKKGSGTQDKKVSHPAKKLIRDGMKVWMNKKNDAAGSRRHR